MLLQKEIETCRKEVVTASVIKHHADSRKNEIVKRLNEEKQLVNTLKEIVKKMNLEISATNSEKDKIRNEYIKSEKLKD